ncbi:MAG: aspartyl/glutamyl-tRNA amidotransferase subunit C [Patescibacteria group bacterium]|nr:aspartyl/glutamyl-tRNA amidotransferase subunit C [Patescibacteria group bacterium]MDE2116750.1 aspartyl/glutamyl-tRNA amidotransferase subunit C [Patescibacteria group bacterium]
MISREEIAKLAALSRLKLSEDEIVRMQGDMTAILSYVDKLKAATASIAATEGPAGGPVMSVNRNVMREDAHPHETGIFTDKLIKLAPQSAETPDGKFVKVKKIL